MMRRFTSLIGILLCLVCLPTKARADYDRSLLNLIIFPQVQFEDATLPEILEFLRLKSSVSCCFDGPGRPGFCHNVVLDRSRLTDAQLSARISIDERDISAEAVIYALCKGLGIGYRIESHAIFISSRAHIGLPPPPSPRVAIVKDGAQKRYLILIGRKQDEK